MRKLVLAMVATLVAAATVEAQAVRSGFEGSPMVPDYCASGCSVGNSANDDGSEGLLSLGFNVDFYGNNFSSLYLNTNGNLTLNGPYLTYTPEQITAGTDPIIAPFFGDVDTRSGNLLAYGTNILGGQSAWGATWRDVCFYSADCSLTNTFQVILVDRSDIAAGDFDMEFNYDRIQWETGNASGGSGGFGGSSAHAGWSNGIGDYYELAGSGVNGAFLDSNLSSGLIYNRLNSDLDGRYVFNVRGGTVVPPVSVPEPGTTMLLMSGLLGLGLVGRRRRDRSGG
jgi:hypothetical protein